MVRGNWQKRVELADARRKETKERKNQTEEQRLHKLWAQDLLRQLDSYGMRFRDSPTILRQLLTEKKLAIWTDVRPCGSGGSMASRSFHDDLEDFQTTTDNADNDDDDDNNNTGKRRSRRTRSRGDSVDQTHDTEYKVGSRKQSDSTSDKNQHPNSSKKKVHPRSRESFESSSSINEGNFALHSTRPKFCRAHFFTGKCVSAGRKKAGCPFTHYSSPEHFTLAQAMASNSETLLATEAAWMSRNVNAVLDPGAMEMMYYVHLKLDSKMITGSELECPALLGETIASELSRTQIKPANIIYVVVGSTLIYDRFREGLQYSNDQDLFQALSSQPTATPLRPTRGSHGNNVESSFHAVPGTILEHILQFLPDMAVAAASLVCKAWHQEIGQNSPNLWQYLLDRRGWPHPRIPGDAETEQRQALYRNVFLEHYAVVRNVNALQAGITGLVGSKKQSVSREMAIHVLATRKLAADCVGVEEWAPNQVLMANGLDCSLRLLQAYAKNGDELLCKEIVCQWLDPYRKTKKSKCRMVAMGLDNDFISCLCSVVHETGNSSSYILTCMSRENFLLGENFDSADSNAVDNSHSIVVNVAEIFLDYFLNCEESEKSGLAGLDAYLLNGGDTQLVQVNVSRSLTSCGKGRVMLEVSISVPSSARNEDRGEGRLLFVERRLLLISIGAGTILWMGRSISSHRAEAHGVDDDMVKMSSIRSPFTSTKRDAFVCSILVFESSGPDPMMLLDVDSAGRVHQGEQIACPWTAGDFSPRPVRDMDAFTRHVQITSGFIVSVDTLRFRSDVEVDADLEATVGASKVVIHGIPRPENAHDTSFCLMLEGVYVYHTTCLHDKYIVLTCMLFHRPLLEVWAIVVHLPSGSEVSRVHLFTAPTLEDLRQHFIRITTNVRDTIGLSLFLESRGGNVVVVLTGDAVRGEAWMKRWMVPTATAEATSCPATVMGKKKKKPKAIKSGKKDGFARGMSLRG